MARITVEDCIDKFPSRFELVLVASHRARKLHSGDIPAIEKDNDKNTVIALREIADSAFTVDQMKENLIQEYQTITISDEEDENIELENIDGSNEKIEEPYVENSIKDPEIDEELTGLIASEDKELESQFEITDDLDNSNNPEKVEEGNE